MDIPHPQRSYRRARIIWIVKLSANETTLERVFAVHAAAKNSGLKSS